MKRALSPWQAAELLRAASIVGPASRDGFLREVDGRLCGIPRQLTDEDVNAVIVSVLGTINVAAPTKEPDHGPQEL
jgi:hypothetical protein